MKKNGTLLSKTDIVLQKNNGEFKFSHFMCVDNFEGFHSFVKVQWDFKKTITRYNNLLSNGEHAIISPFATMEMTGN